MPVALTFFIFLAAVVLLANFLAGFLVAFLAFDFFTTFLAGDFLATFFFLSMEKKLVNKIF